jgi:hypothetical protein
MSNDPDHSSQGNDQPLFQNMDEQERTYAPEQVPGGVQPASSDAPYAGSAVPLAPPTNLTTPEVTIAAPASKATNRQAEEVEDNRDEA